MSMSNSIALCSYSTLDELSSFEGFNKQRSAETNTICFDNPEYSCKKYPNLVLVILYCMIKYSAEPDDLLARCMLTHSEYVQPVCIDNRINWLISILSLNNPIKDVFSKYSGVTGELLPLLKPCIDFEQNKFHRHNVYEHLLSVVDLCKTDDPIIKFAALVHDVGKPESFSLDEKGYRHFYGHPAISKRIVAEALESITYFSDEEKSKILRLVEFHDLYSSMKESSVRRAIRTIGEDLIDDWLILKDADIADHLCIGDDILYYVDNFKEALFGIREKDSAFSLKDLDINGEILMNELDLQPGREIGIILNSLKESVESGAVVNSRNALLDAAKSVKATIR